MLNKTERLNHSLFAKYYEQGKRVHNKYTTIIFTPLDKFLVAVVVGKKVAKKAHDRNQIKRRLSGVVELLKKEQMLTGAFIIITKPDIKNLTKKEFQTVIKLEVGRTLK